MTRDKDGHCVYCDCGIEYLEKLIPQWPDYHTRCKALYDYQHDKTGLSDEEYQVLIHILSGGWDPDCSDQGKICKELGVPCSCSSTYNEKICGQS